MDSTTKLGKHMEYWGRQESQGIRKIIDCATSIDVKWQQQYCYIIHGREQANLHSRLKPENLIPGNKGSIKLFY